MEEVLRTAVRVVMEPALRLIRGDPLQWSERPCKHAYEQALEAALMVAVEPGSDARPEAQRGQAQLAPGR